MAGTDERRRELGAFLRARREHLVRADYGLPPVGRARTGGLRREEIAVLSGVSVTWYTWLEQGRDINPSRQVLEAIALNMRLSAAERGYVLELAGFAFLPTDAAPDPAPLPDHLSRLIDGLLPSPAFVVSPDWNIGGWNRAYEILYPNIAVTPPQDRNLLQFIFTDPYVRQMLPDWPTTSRQFLAEYRAEAGALLGDPAHVALVERLREQSTEFAQAWAQHEIGRFTSRERRFHHPDAGELIFEHHRLTPSDVPNVHIVIYFPLDDTGTRDKLEALLSRGTE